MFPHVLQNTSVNDHIMSYIVGTLPLFCSNIGPVHGAEDEADLFLHLAHHLVVPLARALGLADQRRHVGAAGLAPQLHAPHDELLDVDLL